MGVKLKLLMQTEKQYSPQDKDTFRTLAESLQAAAETYSNVHRGAGLYSSISTQLYEHCRAVFLDYWHLSPRDWTVVFGSDYAAERCLDLLKPADYRLCRSVDWGLPLGLTVLALKKRIVRMGVPPLSGGGTIRLVSPGWVVWADAPDRLEAGTPPILNAITLARVLELVLQPGGQPFKKEQPFTSAAVSDVFAPFAPGFSGEELLRLLEESLPARNLKIPLKKNRRAYVYLDHAASKPVLKPVLDVYLAALNLPENAFENVIRHTAGICETYFNAPPGDYELIFCANTSEAINMLAAVLPQTLPGATPWTVINSVLDHHSNELPWRYAPGWRQIRLRADDLGWIDLAQLEEVLTGLQLQNKNNPQPSPVLVSVCGASNVLGTINDLAAISKLVHAYGARLLVDAAQLAAHRKLDLQALQIDYLVFSGHKVYAPFGSGALLARRGWPGTELLGQFQKSGTQNVAGIAALGAALELLQRVGLNVIEQRERELSVYLIQNLAAVPGIQLYGLQDTAARDFKQRSGVVSFRLKQVPHNVLAFELAADGFGLRQGCFCAHLLVKQLMHIQAWRARLADAGSFVLPRLTAGLLPGLVRVSLGLGNTHADIDALIDSLQAAARRPRNGWERQLAASHNAWPFAESKCASQWSAFIRSHCRRVFPAM